MKKEAFYKTKRNQNGKGYFLEEAKGYKKTYTNETKATIFLYFDKNCDGWNITEYQTGALASVKMYSTLKEAETDANDIIKIIFKMWNDENIKQLRQIKQDLICQL